MLNSEKLTELFEVISEDQFMHDDAEPDAYGGTLTWELVESYGGEGDGSSYWTVYKFTDTETNETAYIQFDGWYASYVGSEFEEWFYVEPKEVLVTQYHRVK